MRLLQIILCLGLVSCQAPMGKGEVVFAFDFEDSFRVGAAAAAGIAASIADTVASKSADSVVKLKDTNATKVGVQQIKSTEAIELGKQSVEKANFVPPP